MHIRTLVSGWVLLAVAGSIIGYTLVHADRVDNEAQIESDLTQASDDYASTLEHWTHERRSDANVLQYNPAIANQVYRSDRSEPVPANATARAQSILDAYVENYGYLGIYLLNRSGDLVLTSRDAPPHPDDVRGMAIESMQNEQVIIEPPDDEKGIGIHMGFVAPVRGEVAPGQQQGGPILGAVVLLVDPLGPPHALLPEGLVGYPEAEILLVASHGEGILYLSSLEDRPGNPRGVVLRSPEEDRAARRALQGGTSYGRFTDYRGVPVLAATHSLREAGWGLVVKVDENKALAPFRRQRRITILVIFSLFAALTGVGIAILFQERGAHAAESEVLSRQFGEIFYNNPQPILIYDRETLMFLEVNQAAIERYGWSREEFKEMSIWGIRPPDEIVRLKDYIGERPVGQVRAGEWNHRTRHGRDLVVEVTSADIEFQGRPARMVIPVDLTEHRDLEERLRQSQKMEAIGQLAGGIAHDFNNMLTAISGYAEMLTMRLAGDPDQQRFAERIRSASEKAEALTRQLLAFSRKQILQPRTIRLDEVVAGMKDMVQRLIGENLELVTTADPSLECVYADPSQIQQVVLNLAVNARDAMPDGGRLTIETHNTDLSEAYAAEYADVTAGPYVLLAVSDTGEGMPREVRRHAFEPFFTTKESGKGTGLGLATVYGIVKQSGGHAAIYSEPGEGTSVKVYLPRVPCVEEEEGEQSPTGSALLGGQETVLVVEDDEMVRSLTTHVLAELGYTLLSAKSGEEALDMMEVRGGEVDLVFTDVVMPGMSGRTMAAELQSRFPGVKILFTSGYTDDAIVHHGILQPGVAFLQKPFSPEGLGRKIRAILDQEGD